MKSYKPQLKASPSGREIHASDVEQRLARYTLLDSYDINVTLHPILSQEGYDSPSLTSTEHSETDLWRSTTHISRHLLACIAVPALGQENLVQLATKLGAKTLVELVTKAGLADTLANGGPFTVFGPTDAAFAKLPKRVVELLMKDTKLLQDVLKFHVLSGKVYSTQLSNDLVVPSLNAMAKIRINIYQMGKVITASGSPVVLPNQNASNGVIHVIDKVMFPLPIESLPGLVGRDPMLSTLLTAVKAAGLVETLSGAGPFTLFAPTNKAFQALPAGALDNLLKNKTALTDVLTYHVLPGTAFSAGLTNGMMAKTVEGKTVTVTIMGGKVMVGKATVEMADLSVSNGVVHIIDSVLLPPMF